MQELTFTLPPGETVLKEASDSHYLRPSASLIGRLCHFYLTQRRLLFCEAYYDILKGREKGVGAVIYEIPLAAIERIHPSQGSSEPHIAMDVRNPRKELEKFVLYFRDDGWTAGVPKRLPERDGWLSAIAKERTAMGLPLAAPDSPTSSEVEGGSRDDGPNILAGKFEILRKIGVGGMGEVYEGKDHTLDRAVAVKKMRSDVKLSGRDKGLFMKEAKLSASLHHPFIVDIYAVLEEDDEIYLIFEFVDGKTIQEILDESGIFPADQLKPALKCVCEALAYAHSRKVVHRDLKPSNIMLTSQGYAKVMDFGIARQIKDTASRLSTTKSGPDASGTLPYMAPEQEMGKADPRSDIFSLGATIYEMVSGELPYIGPNFYLQKEKRAYKPLSELSPEAPQDLVLAVDRALSFDAKDRFQTVGEFAKALGVG